jgi:ATP-binding cassette, subfamily C, bacterial exporter for protease/lipase
MGSRTGQVLADTHARAVTHRLFHGPWVRTGAATAGDPDWTMYAPTHFRPDTYSGLTDNIDRRAFWAQFRSGLWISAMLNVTALASPIYLNEIYNRVLSSGSGETLFVLTVLCIAVLVMGAALEQQRATAFLQASAGLYADLEPHVYRASHAKSLAGAQGRRGQAFDDLDAVRGVLGGPIPGAFFDILFAPLFLIALFTIHFWIGAFALVTMAAMGAIAVLTQWVSDAAIKSSYEAQLAAGNLAEGQLRGAEAAAAMGFVSAARARWAQANRKAVAQHIFAASQAGGLSASARAIRGGAQTMIIGLAALLALTGSVAGGGIIAASIILSRLLAPLDQFLGGWRQLAQARVAAQRLSLLLSAAAPETPTAAPAPRANLMAEGLSASSATQTPILRGVSLSLEPGEVLGLAGAAGSGKSTLLRCLLGVWPYVSGIVRLDGIPLRDADRDRIGPYLGFLPQNADLFPGTIADNICRFGPVDHAKLIDAATTTGAHDMIARLPRGFDTDVGEAGHLLSAGQRRRIALARAIYGWPVLVCLDEPEAHLDQDGERGLRNTIAALKQRGACVVVAAHRPALIAAADKILVLAEGRVAEFGPADIVLPKIMPTGSAAANPPTTLRPRMTYTPHPTPHATEAS